MTVLREHRDLGIEIVHNLFIYFGIKNLFNSNIKAVILALMDGTKASHRDLLSDG